MSLRSSFASGVLALLAASAAVSNAFADDASCRTIRIGDGGWTDNQAVNGFAEVILPALGYEPKITVLALPVIFASLKNNDLDIHLDFWAPNTDALAHPYLEERSIEKLHTNLTGIKITFAVPTYLWAAGLKDFDDISRFKTELKGEIYGLEPGNDSGDSIRELIKENKFGLSGFRLIESSEQGMLSQLSRATREKQPILFLGWTPHPMNIQHDFKYLTGGDAVFGEGSTGWTATRKGYPEQCPNVAKLLTNLTFDLEMMNAVMLDILDKGMTGKAAATDWLKANPQALDAWLDGVKTLDGSSGLDAVRSSL